MAEILIVDDEDRIRHILKIMLSGAGHSVAEACDGQDALESLYSESFDLVISDMRMDRLNGKELLAEIKKNALGVPVIFITAFASLESAVDALRLGAADYLVKPFDEKQVLLAVERALGVGRLLIENARLRRAVYQDAEHEQPIFRSEKMLHVKDMAEKVARTDATVLVTGESGTGKEVVSRLIHMAGNRKEQRFVAVNCAAISHNLIESELFGYEKGAFTGADRRKEGKFEYADKGTLFLDEIGELPMEAQSKLLRVIQEKVIQRVGSNVDCKVDVRLVCATNKDLMRLVKEQKFREDLYYRLAVFPIHVPPLRERKADILPLATHFILKYIGKNDSSGDLFTPAASKILENYSWKGNVRELANIIERVMILKDGKLPVSSDDLRFLELESKPEKDTKGLIKIPPGGIDFDELEKNIVEQALEMTSWNQSAAARLLGLTRARFRTLMNLMRE